MWWDSIGGGNGSIAKRDGVYMRYRTFLWWWGRLVLG